MEQSKGPKNELDVLANVAPDPGANVSVMAWDVAALTSILGTFRLRTSIFEEARKWDCVVQHREASPVIHYS